MSRQPVASTCVCTSLRMATRLVARHYDSALAPAGLTANAYSILVRLDRDGAQPLGKLAARLAMDRSTLSREISPLVERTLVTTAPGKADRRQTMLALSADGEAIVQKAQPLWAEAQKELVRRFGGERTARLLSELHALVGAA